tara:strand:- start:1794 stop:2486 length:693 start_codon:yes stop_codon:yes gene_type:complete
LKNNSKINKLDLLINNMAFDQMIASAESDNTGVSNLFGEENTLSSESIHNMLMVAGMYPGVGNIADATDAILYALEGEFGNAALSAGAAIPVVGQYVSAHKALNAAKKAGEKTTKLYRGYEKWYPGQMVENGMFVSSGKKSTRTVKGERKKVLYTTTDKKIAESYSRDGVVLEFEVPETWLKDNALNVYGKKNLDVIDDLIGTEKGFGGMAIFEEGLPVGFLIKVHKAGK